MRERGLDHLVYATPDLDASVKELTERLGTAPVPGGAHPGWGTRNALIGLGTGVYLEIIGCDPTQPDPERSRPFLIDDLTEARLVTWAYRHPDPESMRDMIERRVRDTPGPTSRAALRHDEIRLGPVRAMSRARTDGDTLHWRLSDPLVLPAGGVIPFVIDWGTTPHPSADLSNECKLLELVAHHPDADTLRPALDVLRPLLEEPDADLSLIAAPEPGLHARIQTPDGVIDLS